MQDWFQNLLDLQNETASKQSFLFVLFYAIILKILL